MQTVTIFRIKKSDHGMEGLVCTPYGFTCYSIEPPDRNNRLRISCIPAGVYTVKIRQSPKYGTIFHVTGVDGRTYILEHWGNWAGDRKKKLRSHSNGCLLFGMKRGWLAGQRAVLHSRTAIRKFMKVMGNQTHRLQIIEAF